MPTQITPNPKDLQQINQQLRNPLGMMKSQSNNQQFNPLFNSDLNEAKDLNKSAIEKRISSRIMQLSEEDNEGGNPEEEKIFAEQEEEF